MPITRNLFSSKIICFIQDITEGEVSILGGHSIDHCKQEKNVYVHVYVPNGFRGRAMDVIARIKKRQNALRRATRHVFTRVAKCIDVDSGIFKNVLYTR
jgi:hypothetical protein